MRREKESRAERGRASIRMGAGDDSRVAAKPSPLLLISAVSAPREMTARSRFWLRERLAAGTSCDHSFLFLG